MDKTDAEFCAQQLRRLDHDRYLTTLFAPAAARPLLIALYAFNTEVARVGEIVSEPIIGQMRLQWWRDAIAEAASGRAAQAPGRRRPGRRAGERRHARGLRAAAGRARAGPR